MRSEFRGWLVLTLLLASVLLPLAAMSGSNGALVLVESHAGGRADCPSTQNDAGISGDAGDNMSYARSFGDDPQFTGKTGCVDDDDYYDYYSFNMTSTGMDVEFELTVPAPLADNDFNIWLEDANGNTLDDSYESSPGGEFEQVSTVGTLGSGTPGTYYFVVTQFSGNGTYSIDAWINSSQPQPDLTPSYVVSNLTAFEVGDAVNVTYTVDNIGSVDLNDSYDIFFVLVDPSDVWNYYMIRDSYGNEVSVSGQPLAANQSQQMSTEITISSNVANGTYLWSVQLDAFNNVTEATKSNNNGYSSVTVTVGTVVNCSGTGADAGTGTDAGDDSATAIDLGYQYSGTLTGCFDSNDAEDFYSVSIFDGQNLTVSLDGQADADNDLFLFDGQENLVNESINPDDADENVSTIGTSWSGAANTYYIKVSKFSGAGPYTLHVVTNGSGGPARVCGWDAQDDLGLGGDAGATDITATSLGVNPTITGMGCLDDLDQIDAYAFDLAGMYGVSIEFNQSSIQDYTLVVADGQGNELASIKSAGEFLSYNTSAISLANLVGSYLMSIHANGEQGNYNLSMTLIDPPPPDLVATSVQCPDVPQGGSTDVMNGSEFSFDLMGESVGGPSNTSFDWKLTLMDENGTQVAILHNGSHDGVLAGADGVIISESGTFTLADNTTLGVYYCRLAIDLADTVSEMDESNNVLQGADFSIILRTVDPWEGDDDHDGILNDEDACPNIYGSSTEDVIGCPDLDGDGWSNDGDAFFNEETQWLDTDSDGFGDDPLGFNGDQCPGETGVAEGTNGTGCPLWIPDTDADGVSDADDDCPGTAAGVVVDETGCEPLPPPPPDNDGDGVSDADDNCPNSPNSDQADEDGDGVGDSCDLPQDEDKDSDADSEPTGEGQVLGGISGMMVAAVVGGILLAIVMVTLLITKDEIGLLLRGSKTDSAPIVSESVVAERATPTVVTPAKKEYEQQLIDQGYSPEQARTYADHYYD